MKRTLAWDVTGGRNESTCKKVSLHFCIGCFHLFNPLTKNIKTLNFILVLKRWY